MRDYEFGNMLAKLRMERGLSQFQMGRLLGVTDKAVSKWENGSAKPRISTCCRLADILGISLNDLLSIPGATASERRTLQMKNSLKDPAIVAEKFECIRPETCDERRVELHALTNMSPMDAVASARSYVKRAAEWKHPAIAITDFAVTQALPEAFEAARGTDVKVIPGCLAAMIQNDTDTLRDADLG